MRRRENAILRLCDGWIMRRRENVILRLCDGRKLRWIVSQIFAMDLWRKTKDCDLRSVMDRSTNICDGSVKQTAENAILQFALSAKGLKLGSRVRAYGRKGLRA